MNIATYIIDIISINLF